MASEVLSGLSIDSSGLNQLSRMTQSIDALKSEVASTNISDKSSEEIKKASKDFEAMLLGQMLDSMWETVPKNEMFGGGREEEYFRDMFTEEISKEISNGSGLGIQNIVQTELEKREK